MNAAHPEVAVAPGQNPGELLRLAREKRDWSQAEVARKLNLTVSSLNHVETGAFDKLPGHTFARGYVRAYAKLLELDQAALVEQFDRFTGTDASGSTVQSLGRVAEPLRLSRTLLRLATAVLLLLLLGLAYFWWQERPERLSDLGALGLKHIEVESADGTTEIHPLDEPEEPAEQAKPADAPATTALALPGQAPAEAAPEVAAVAPAGQAVQSAPAVAAPVAAALPASVAAPAQAPASVASVPAPVAPAAPLAPAEAPATSPAPAAVLPGEGEGLVQVDFSGDCWAQVTDAKGRVLISTVKHKGETLQVAGKAPLELRLGNARVVAVSYDGAPVSLGTISSSGTARLKLGQ